MEDDEEELLYGESSKSVSSASKPASSKSMPGVSAAAPVLGAESSSFQVPPSPPPPDGAGEPTQWALVARENGALEIYSMPEFKLCFLVKNLSLKPKVLSDQSIGPGERCDFLRETN